MCKDHLDMPLCVLGTRKLKFSPNLRTDRNENRILFTSELENVLTLYQLHVHHPPAMYVCLNVIYLDSCNKRRDDRVCVSPLNGNNSISKGK